MVTSVAPRIGTGLLATATRTTTAGSGGGISWNVTILLSVAVVAAISVAWLLTRGGGAD